VRGGASDDDPAVAYLLSMWVAPVARRRGVGGRLIEALLGWAEEAEFTVVRLDAGESNGAAIALYEHEGFRRTGRISALPAPRHHIREVEMEVALPRRPRGE
jgi:N6-L-threonylcarbamoyladenine synthase/ribosomal-protein-alanine N-acetyltransferase